MSTSVLVDLALEDFFLDVFGPPTFLEGLELWDLSLVGFEQRRDLINLDLFILNQFEILGCNIHFTIVGLVQVATKVMRLCIHL